MNLSPENSAELHDLLGRLCNDELASDGFQRLVDLLNESHDARQFYVQYVDMNESLRQMAVGLEQEGLVADVQEKLTELRALNELSANVTEPPLPIVPDPSLESSVFPTNAVLDGLSAPTLPFIGQIVS